MDLEEATGTGGSWPFLALIVVLGCMVGVVGGAVTWAVFADPVPPGGSGNRRTSCSWGYIGDLVGSAIGLLLAVKIRRRSN